MVVDISQHAATVRWMEKEENALSLKDVLLLLNQLLEMRLDPEAAICKQQYQRERQQGVRRDDAPELRCCLTGRSNEGGNNSEIIRLALLSPTFDYSSVRSVVAVR